MTSNGRFNQERHAAAASQAKLTINAKSMRRDLSFVSSSEMDGTIVSLEDSDQFPPLDDLEQLGSSSQLIEVEQAKIKYSSVMSVCVDRLKRMDTDRMPVFLDWVNQIMRKAWAVPAHGYALAYSLCNVLRSKGGLDVLMDNCVSSDGDLQLSSARLLEQCLTQENRSYVVERGLDKVHSSYPP